MNIKVHKDYSDELIQKVFVKEGLGTVKNKEEFCEIFKAAKEKIEIKNKADSMVYQTEKQLKEHGDKLPAEVKQPVEDGIAKLKKAIEADDTETMKTVMAEIEQHLMKFGEQIYQQAQAQQQANPNPGADAKPKNDDGVVDAEVVD